MEDRQEVRIAREESDGSGVCMARASKKIPGSRGVDEAEKGRHTSDPTTDRWDQPDGKEGGGRKAWG